VVPIHIEVIVLGIPNEDLQAIANILATGYLRLLFTAVSSHSVNDPVQPDFAEALSVHDK
jgi:hypothetical protein